MAQAAAADLYQNVELIVSCTGLADRDLTSKSDPFVVFYSDQAPPGAPNRVWREEGRTEVVQNELHPKFKKTFLFPYRFEIHQHIRFVVYDEDKASSKALSDQDLLGETQTEMAQIMGATGMRATLQLRAATGGGGKLGTITIQGVPIASTSTDTVVIRPMGFKLDKKDFFGKSDPLLIISKQGPNGQWMAIHQTETIYNTLNPSWKPFEIPLVRLCNGDLSLQLQIECYDEDNHKANDFIGSAVLTAQAMISGQRIELIHPKKKGKASYKNSGELSMAGEVIRHRSFAEYLHEGLEVGLIVGIDFTASNGDPRQPGTLHHISPQQPNQYMAAIMSVGSILAFYDSDKLFPVYGFGAKLPDNSVSHMFPCSLNNDYVSVQGVQGIIDVYAQALLRVQLYGPTNFAPLIRKATEEARSEKSKYTVLLILTDGEITDMDATKDALVDAGPAPLSVVIVGVGTSADWRKMDVLDGDTVPLTNSRGQKVCRDLVQFVPLNKFAANTRALAAEVLKEIPGQVAMWAKMSKFTPTPRPVPSAPPIISGPPAGIVLPSGPPADPRAPPPPGMMPMPQQGTMPYAPGGAPPPGYGYPPPPPGYGYPQAPPGQYPPQPALGPPVYPQVTPGGVAPPPPQQLVAPQPLKQVTTQPPQLPPGAPVPSAPPAP
eukprot:TRINITY_DN13334_c0_g1_i2.p1 TRINITY_DN13334_c0_g1~~TRINITY_DN13334_c0_g1_i2.p1  ORF type:complete len:661 (-),score=137.80 TRINITY_DN13334_c0_g1_i2:246-2228(-)